MVVAPEFAYWFRDEKNEKNLLLFSRLRTFYG
jgi:hypothetical protein